MIDHQHDFQPEPKSGIRICTFPNCCQVERARHRTSEPEAPKLDGLSVLEDWKDPRSPSSQSPVAWRWRRTGGVWNYQEDRQHIPNTVCEPLFDHPAPSESDDRLRLALEEIRDQLCGVEPHKAVAAVAWAEKCSLAALSPKEGGK